jgi:O-antigen ligase
MCALNPRHWRRSLPIFVGLVGLGVGWITMILKARYLGDLLLHPDWYATFAIRHDILHQSIRMIMDHPLAGIGFGTYDDVAHTQYGPIALPWFFRRGWHAHNTFLHLLAETGIVGILAWCYLWFTIVRFLVRRWRDDVRDRLHGSAALCVLLAFFVLSMTESVTAARLHASLRMNLTLTFLVIYGIRLSGGIARRPAGAPSAPLLGKEPTFGTSG